MLMDICEMQITKPDQNKPSQLPHIDNKKAKLQSPTLINDDNYAKYFFVNKGIVSIKSNEKKVAICKLEWLILREGGKNTEWRWLTLTLSFCLSLLFSSICLVGTATFQQGGKFLWLPLLAATAHIAGCVIFGLLSAYFWQKRRNTKQDSIYKSLKKTLDNKFKIHSAGSSSQF